MNQQEIDDLFRRLDAMARTLIAQQHALEQIQAQLAACQQPLTGRSAAFAPLGDADFDDSGFTSHPVRW
jgi:hypothetical protein